MDVALPELAEPTNPLDDVETVISSLAEPD